MPKKVGKQIAKSPERITSQSPKNGYLIRFGPGLIPQTMTDGETGETPANKKTENEMKVTNTIVWDHRGRVPDGGLGHLEIRITVDRKSYYFGTGIKCHKSEFVAGQIINCPGAKELNERLAIIYSKELAHVNACVNNNIFINIEDIRREVWKLIDVQSDRATFLEWIEGQIPTLNLSDGTIKHYQPLITRLTEYGKIRKWQDVTTENISGFDNYLHTLTKPISDARLKAGEKPKKLSDGAIYNYHKCLKALINRAVLFDKLVRNPYDRLKGKFKRGEKESVEYLYKTSFLEETGILASKSSTITSTSFNLS